LNPLTGLHFRGIAEDFACSGLGGDGVAAAQDILRGQELKTAAKFLQRGAMVPDPLSRRFAQSPPEVTQDLP